jgi:hypothetical protein
VLSSYLRKPEMSMDAMESKVKSEEMETTEEIVSNAAADSQNGSETFSEIVFQVGCKCMAYEQIGGPVYLAKILDISNESEFEGSKAKTPTKKRSSSESVEERPLKIGPASATKHVADSKCNGVKHDEIQSVKIHFEGWSAKQDRSDTDSTCRVKIILSLHKLGWP